MAELEDGSIVHASRIRMGGDLHGKMKVKNLWRKKFLSIDTGFEKERK